MKYQRIQCRAFKFEPKTPPADIQLWDIGDNPTDYGVHRWTERSHAEVMGFYEARGNPLLIDIDHNASEEEKAKRKTDEPPPTGGYCRLEVRDGAPWLVFEWSAYGAQQISTGERLFLSPEYLADKETGEIVRLLRVSLVGEPGTHNARILATSDIGGPLDFAMFLAALKATLSADDPKAAISALIKEVEEAAGGGAPEPPPDDPTAAGGKPEDDKDKPVAAKAVPVPAPPAAPAAPVVSGPSFQDVRAAAKAEADTIRRDLLLDKHGERLEPSVARWAASQPLSIVKGLLDSLPKDATQVAAKRVSATRGDKQGGNAGGAGLPDEESRSLAEQMGVVRASARGPRKLDNGHLVMPAMTPSEWNARLKEVRS